MIALVGIGTALELIGAFLLIFLAVGVEVWFELRRADTPAEEAIIERPVEAELQELEDAWASLPPRWEGHREIASFSTERQTERVVSWERD